MALFDSGKIEELLLSLQNFKMMHKASGTLISSINIHYMHLILCGEVLHKFDTLHAQVGSKNTTQLKRFILGLGTYFFQLMCCQSTST